MPPFLASWSRAISQHHDDVTALVSACWNATDAIEKIKRAVVKCIATPESQGTAAAVAAIEESNFRLHQVLSAMVPAKHFNYQHSSYSSMTADKFFAVVEVTEMVCMLLELPDLLSMRQVNKHFSAVITGSPKLRNKLEGTTILTPLLYRGGVNFAPDRTVLRRLPFPEVSRVSSYPQATAVSRRGYLALYCRERLWKFSKPGRYLSQVLIMSPALKTLKGYQRCCGSYQRAINSVENTNGITFGDLYRAFIRIQAVHAMCPHAPAKYHDDDGNVAAPIWFYGALPGPFYDECLEKLQLQLQKDLENKRSVSRLDARKRQEEKKARTTRMEDYCKAKLLAYESRRPIPTLKEYEETKAVVEYFAKSD